MNLTPELLDEEGKGILFARVATNLLEEGKVEQATLITEVYKKTSELCSRTLCFG